MSDDFACYVPSYCMSCFHSLSAHKMSAYCSWFDSYSWENSTQVSSCNVENYYDSDEASFSQLSSSYFRQQSMIYSMSSYVLTTY